MFRIAVLAVLFLFIDRGHAEVFVDGSVGTKQSSSVGIGVSYQGFQVEYLKPHFKDSNFQAFDRNDGPCPLGCGVTHTYQNFESKHADSKALLFGYRIPAGNVTLVPLLGVHKYYTLETGYDRVVDIDQATSEAIQDVSHFPYSTSSGYSWVGGVELVSPVFKHVDLVVRGLRYGAIDKTTLEFGVRVGF